jgi:hypothetical protein
LLEQDGSATAVLTQLPMFPRYSYPPLPALALARDWLLLRPRSFHRDGQACIQRLRPPLRVFGEENIPQGGPCLITLNHYYRPGFGAWWMPLAISAVAPMEIHFVMTSELTYPGKWYAPLGMPVSRFVLRRAGHMYGFTTMPPMPPRRRDVEARARSVREVLSYARKSDRPVLGLAPEGGDAPGGILSWPPSGSGRFVQLLAGMGLPIIPVGCYEEDGAFCLSFGAEYRLETPKGSAEERDREAARQVMSRLARQLPPRLRGEFL